MNFSLFNPDFQRIMVINKRTKCGEKVENMRIYMYMFFYKVIVSKEHSAGKKAHSAIFPQLMGETGFAGVQ